LPLRLRLRWWLWFWIGASIDDRHCRYWEAMARGRQEEARGQGRTDGRGKGPFPRPKILEFGRSPPVGDFWGKVTGRFVGRAEDSPDTWPHLATLRPSTGTMWSLCPSACSLWPSAQPLMAVVAMCELPATSVRTCNSRHQPGRPGQPGTGRNSQERAAISRFESRSKVSGSRDSGNAC
jgi:hypothetical protein